MNPGMYTLKMSHVLTQGKMFTFTQYIGIKSTQDFVAIYMNFRVNLRNLCRMIYTINRVLFTRKPKICRVLKHPSNRVKHTRRKVYQN